MDNPPEPKPTEPSTAPEPAPAKIKRRRFPRWLLILLLLLVAGRLLFPAWVRHTVRDLDSRPNPARSYEEAVARFTAMRPLGNATLMPECEPFLLTHGHKTDRVAVLYHGLTNCPQQFRLFAQQLHDEGWNVVVPLLPRHGCADRRSENLTAMTAEELRASSDTTVDIACGLGEHVTVCGLSAGGVMAAWIAQHRPEVERAVLVAPALGFIPTKGRTLNRLMFFLLPILPDIKTDGFAVDPKAPKHTYPGFSSHSLGQLLRLSASALVDATKNKPAVQLISILTSEGDEAINRVFVWQLAGLWRLKGTRQLDFYDFPKHDGIEHDMIDPAQPYQKIGLVYPVLRDLMGD